MSPEAVATRYTEAFIEDMERVGVLPPDVRPKATEEIDEMIALVGRLIEAGHAYVVEGDVYFDLRSFPAYGQLSHRHIDELEGGHRDLQASAIAGIEDRKRDPLDFALWKAAKPEEPFWDSPWGPGRPGWHIECSAMSRKYLGLPLDIHGGGADLIFPHHENEMAQSEAAFDEPFCRYWLHGGMLQLNAEKMSKSLGNYLLLHEVLDRTEPAVLRMLMLQTHYRSPLDFSDARLEEAQASLARIGNAVKKLEWALDQVVPDPAILDQLAGKAAIERARCGFIAAMDDDFNTAGAIGAIFSFVGEMNAAIGDQAIGEEDRALVQEAHGLIIELLGVLGITLPHEGGESYPAEVVELARRQVGFEGHDSVDAVGALLEGRAAARKAKDFALADAIRDDLVALGFVIEDTPQGARVTFEG